MLPNFFITGAAKSGTSSLDRYLSQHPDIYVSPKKEAHYFSIPNFPPHFNGPGDDGMNHFTIRDKASYQQLFQDVSHESAVGESSVFYLYYPGTAERIRAEIPHAKILIMLRNPVDRAFSAYTHFLRDERESLDFTRSLLLENERRNKQYEPLWFYKELGLYSEQVKRYLQVFGREQVKVILFEDFARDTEGIVRDVFHFLGVDPSFQIDTSIRHNESGVPKSRWIYNFIAKPNGLKELVKPLVPATVREQWGNRAKSMVLEKVTMEAETRKELATYFLKDIERLEALLSRDLSVWKR